MRIWIINHDAIPPSMGGLTRHYYFSKYLTAQGHQVKIFTASTIHNTTINMISDHSKYVEKECDGVMYTFIRASDYTGNGLVRVYNMLEFTVRIWSVCKKFEKPDIVYTSSPNLFTAVSAILLAKKIKRPCVVEIRDPWPASIVYYRGMSEKNPVIQLLYILEKWVYKKADKLIFTMKGGKDYITDKGWKNSIDLKKVLHINNGVDLEEFCHNRDTCILEDEDLQDTTVKKVVYCGSIRQANRVGLILDMAKILQERGVRDVRILIWGTGNEVEALQTRLEKENIKNVRFKGFVKKKYIPGIVCRADINLVHWAMSPLLKYGCSYNKLFDYLAAGKPIFSTVQVGHSILKECRCGIETEQYSPENFADGIIHLLNLSEREQNQMGQNAMEAARQYDYQMLTKKLLSVFESVL